MKAALALLTLCWLTVADAGEFFLGGGLLADAFNDTGKPWGRYYGGYGWRGVLTENDRLDIRAEHWSGFLTVEPYSDQVNAVGFNYELHWEYP